MDKIDFGLIIRPSSFGLLIKPSELPEYNRRCIQAVSPVFTTIWVEDHLQWDADDTLESLTTLSYLAAEHPTFRVGNLVLCQSYRNPALVAKMMANLHFLSGGRCILGLGAGWKNDEYQAYGYRVPSTVERCEQLEEAILIIRSMWTSQPATFKGKHYQITNAYCIPQPSPSIPILVGGGGERFTLPIAARYADWWNYNACPIEEYKRKVTLLREHCRRIGRNPDEIKLTYSGTIGISDDASQILNSSAKKHVITGNTQAVIQELERYCVLGVTHFMLRFSNFASLERFVSKVAPHFLSKSKSW